MKLFQLLMSDRATRVVTNRKRRWALISSSGSDVYRTLWSADGFMPALTKFESRRELAVEIRDMWHQNVGRKTSKEETALERETDKRTSKVPQKNRTFRGFVWLRAGTSGGLL